MWDLLFARQVELLGTRVVSPFLDGIDLLRLSHPGVPDVEGLNAILTPRTGWRRSRCRGWFPTTSSSRCWASGYSRSAISSARATSSIISRRPTASTTCSAISRCSRTTISPRWPSISARSAAPAIAAGEGRRAARLYWHSVEFGLAKEGGELKILGAGLASSFGESHFSLESDAVERLPFSVERAVNTPYKHDAFQPRYLVSRSLEQTIAEVLALTPERLLAL